MTLRINTYKTFYLATIVLGAGIASNAYAGGWDKYTARGDFTFSNGIDCGYNIKVEVNTTEERTLVSGEVCGKTFTIDQHSVASKLDIVVPGNDVAVQVLRQSEASYLVKLFDDSSKLLNSQDAK